MKEEPERCSVMIRIFVVGGYDFEVELMILAGGVMVV